MVATWLGFAVRWRLLLAPAPIPLSDTFSYIMIGYLGNAILPLRLGDIGRIALISQKHRLNLGFTSATVVTERLLDVLTVAAIAGFLMLATPVPVLIRSGVQAAAVTTFGLVVALALLSRSQTTLARLELFLSAHLPQKVLEPAFGILDKFVQGLQVTRNLGQMLKIGFLSVLSWGIAGLSILCFVRAFQLQVPWQAALLVLAITNLGSAIPSSPGTIGVYEFLTMLALSVWLSEQSTVLGFATATHAAYLALSIALGLVAAWHEGVRLSAIIAEGRQQTGEEP